MSDRQLHDQLLAAGERLAGGYDPNPWVAINETGERVATECCGSYEWLEPLLVSARCPKCGGYVRPPQGVTLYR